MVSGSEFSWVANHPALDFVNSELIRAGARTDLFEDFDSVVAWLARANLLGGDREAAVRASFPQPRERQQLLVAARELRAALRTLIERRAAGKRPSADALATVNALLARDAGHVQLSSTGGAFVRDHVRPLRDPRALLQPVVSAAVELLCDVDPARVKACANHACILYFLDTSKNRTRRWCSMELCGNRTKVAAHYRRQREES